LPSRRYFSIAFLENSSPTSLFLRHGPEQSKLPLHWLDDVMLTGFDGGMLRCCCEYLLIFWLVSLSALVAIALKAISRTMTDVRGTQK